MTSEAVLGLEILVVVFVSGWLAGYGWALYRALGWVDRMRAWAGHVVEANNQQEAVQE